MNKYLKEMQKECHNPYFNRWFSAMRYEYWLKSALICHNPYFNRWFSAIMGIRWSCAV